MKAKTRHQVNRRAFLRGAAGITLGLPFLEGLPERSAWAQDANPVFSFFLMTQNGVIQDQFWPTSTGLLSAATMTGRAVEPLIDHASDLLIVNGLRAPGGSPGDCGHAQGCVQAITGVEPGSGGNSSTSGGPSADVVIANALNPDNLDGLNLYSGTQQGAFIAERLSFTDGHTPARPAQLNPYETFRRLVGVGSTDDTTGSGGSGAGGGTADASTVDELLLRKKSVNDQVLDEFNHLLGLPQLSAEDRRRLENHMAGIRQIETNLMDTGDTINEINDGTGEFYGCNISPATMTALDAFKDGINFNSNGHMIEDIVALHAETVALTFSCGANRTAALQWGNGTDGTVYSTNATGSYNKFHKISHQTNSNTSSGNDSFAAAAHAEIDLIRMTTFAKVVQSFKNYGLMDRAFVMHTNSLGVGKAHTFNNLPIIIAGNAGGFLKQGEYMNISDKTNAPLLASLITAAGVPTTSFGAGGGQLTEIHA